MGVAANDTNQNLTLSITASDVNGDPFQNITTWYRNGSSIMLLNMPFEGGSNSTWTKDYSGNGNNATGTANWSSSIGHDGFGAYNFNGSQYLNVTSSDSINSKVNFSITAWVKPGFGTNNRNNAPIVKRAGNTYSLELISFVRSLINTSFGLISVIILSSRLVWF